VLLARDIAIRTTLVVGVLLAGCGGDATPGGERPAAGRVTRAATPATDTAAWRLQRRPIVVVDPLRDGTRIFQVYFRLNRPLSTYRNAVEVLLEGIWTLNVSGTGYDGSTSPACYMRYFDNDKAFPRSLRRAKAGDMLDVELRLLQAPRRTLRARAPLQVAEPGELGNSTSHLRTKALGCS
jgi:hypothetical protein